MSAGAPSGVRRGDVDRTAGRRAALLVHALPARDRQWLLAQLPPTARERLANLLDEIRSLGIPSQPDLLQDLLASTGRAASPVGPAATPATTTPAQDSAGAAAGDAVDFESLCRDLRAVTPPRLAQLLRDEPDALTERVLIRLDVEQRRAVQRRLQPTARAAKEPRLPSARPLSPGEGAKLEGALLEALLRRAGALQTAPKRTSSEWLTRPWLRPPTQRELPARGPQ